MSPAADDGAATGRYSDPAVTAIFREHYGSLVRLATWLVADAATAEEVVQDSFAAVDAGWPRLRDPGRAPAYLRAAVVNRSRSLLRHSLMLADDDTRGLLAQLRAADGSVIGSPDRGAVLNAVLALPPRQREALILRYHQGLAPARIAEHMGIKRETVRSHLYRGLAALRAVLDRDQAALEPQDEHPPSDLPAAADSTTPPLGGPEDNDGR